MLILGTALLPSKHEALSFSKMHNCI